MIWFPSYNVWEQKQYLEEVVEVSQVLRGDGHLRGYDPQLVGGEEEFSALLGQVNHTRVRMESE